MSKLKDKFLSKHNVESVNEVEAPGEIGIEEALVTTLEHEEEINQEYALVIDIAKNEYSEDEIPFSDFDEKNMFVSENEECIDVSLSKELVDKLIAKKFSLYKCNMSKKRFKHFKRAYNRNRLYIKLKKLGRKL